MTASRNIRGDIAAAKAARDVIRASNNGRRDGDPAFWELLRAANRRIRDLEHDALASMHRDRYRVTVTTDSGVQWVETFDSAEGAAAEVFEHLVAVEGAAFTITTAAA